VAGASILLKNHSDLEVRKLAAKALGYVKGQEERAAESLLHRLDDPEMSDTVLKALNRLELSDGSSRLSARLLDFAAQSDSSELVRTAVQVTSKNLPDDPALVRRFVGLAIRRSDILPSYLLQNGLWEAETAHRGLLHKVREGLLKEPDSAEKTKALGEIDLMLSRIRSH
jgi:hypothetical protein